MTFKTNDFFMNIHPFKIIIKLRASQFNNIGLLLIKLT